ncbi:thioesterase II family protein [Flavobacterium sp. WG21]|uniref:thioesterase II family protein n=1 Tax=Flavobacterium sp. WG21 TaxID=1229487 RepID=UPI00034B3A9A|nr:thioesterase domain-containing protein [Flavobacterium sp. WG21]
MNEKIKLFCFPFAGGSKYSFNLYLEYASENIQLIPFDYPGRGARINEILLSNIDEIVEDVFKSIKGQLNEQYAFYGHSMGSLVAYLLIKKLIKHNLPLPFYLFVSGAGGPSVLQPKERSTLPTDEFINELRTIGGSPESVLENSELIKFFEPILRTDFKSIETYSYEATTKFNIPISVIIGDQEGISIEEAKAWGRETSLEVDIEVLPGHHFFIYEHHEKLMSLINETLLASVNVNYNG